MFGKYVWLYILIVFVIFDGKLLLNLLFKYSFYLNNLWWNNFGEGRLLVYVLIIFLKLGLIFLFIRIVGINLISFLYLVDKFVNCCLNLLDMWFRNGIVKFSL